MVELKPCPFCGGKANLVGYGLTGVMKVVQCSDCGARTRAFDPKVKRGENVIEAWNRRAEPWRGEDEPLYKYCPYCGADMRKEGDTDV